jgi:UDP-2,3-diacylglucosamine pyrophosphatase LpxH
MKKSKINLPIIILLAITSTINYSCNKHDIPIVVTENLTVSFPLLQQNHNTYYVLDHDAKSLEIVFNHALDENTMDGNFELFEFEKSLSSKYEITLAGNAVFIRFHSDFILNDGWKYELRLSKYLKTTNGLFFSKNQIVEFRTKSKHISKDVIANTNDTISRTLIACISDIHCGDERAINGDYSWFGKNADALEDFLEFIEGNSEIKELVILGDLFDEWLVPYGIAPFDSSLFITNSKEYFKAIASASVNAGVFSKLNNIANTGDIDVIYVSGNHDMLMTEDILNEIIPNAIWKSDVEGLGKYKPVPEILMEHGHRYDFFNCPQPLVNENHILPPGYFISRLYAAGLNSNLENKKLSTSINNDAEFVTAWSLATAYTIATFMMDMDTIPMDSANIKMAGIDGYSDNFSFNGVRDMYSANIQEQWQNTQLINKVPKPMSVFLAILNGTFLYSSVLYEYLVDIFSPDAPKIIAFGHSHKPEILVFPTEDNFTGIYANSGSWIDDDQCSHKVRTFLIISPGEMTGSELDIVSLYQYNINSDDGKQSGVFKPILLKEESIERF